MPVAVYQGRIDIPIFTAPYNNTTGRNQFHEQSDYPMLTQNGWFAPSGIFGGIPSTAMWYDVTILNPFQANRHTNNLAGTNYGTFGLVALNYYACIDGNLYMAVSAGAATGGLFQTFTRMNLNGSLIRPPVPVTWSVAQPDVRPSLSYSYFQFMGYANVNPNQCPAVVGYGSGSPILFGAYYRQDNRQVYPRLGFSNNMNGFNISSRVLCGADTDLISTHYVSSENSGLPAFKHSWLVNNPAIPNPTVFFDDSNVTIDNGMGSAFQTTFNTMGSGVQRISKAPAGWLVKLNNAMPNIVQDQYYLLFDLSCRRYWSLHFNPQTISTISGFNNQQIQDVHFDPTGVAYILSNFFTNPKAVGHSYGINLSYYPISFPIYNAPQFTLPCMPDCSTAFYLPSQLPKS